MLLNKDRYYPTKTLIKHGVVVHDSESGDGSSSRLIELLKSPGDRISDSGRVYGAGYHAVTDGLGGYIQVADATAGPYAAPPLNPTWWHICMPGYARQTREEWLDALSFNHIRGVAKFIVDRWREDGRSWPLNFVYASQMVNGEHGYTSHAQVSLAWRETTHTDPGISFPWDILGGEVRILSQSTPSQPPEEDDMKLAVMTLDNTVPPTTFLGYVEPGVDAAGNVQNKFWKVYWIDGNDPQAMKMLEDQRAAGAQEFHFGEHVSVSLFYENDRFPNSTHSDGRGWNKSDWGAAPNIK